MRVATDTPEGFQTLPAELRTQIVTDFSLGAAAALALLLLGLVFIFVATHLVVARDEVSRRGADGPDEAGLLRGTFLAYPRTLISATVGVVGSAAALGLGVAVWSIPFAAVGLPNGLATGVAILSLILVLAPGMWLLSSVSMTTAVSTLEATSVIASIQRSAFLVKAESGPPWPTFCWSDLWRVSPSCWFRWWPFPSSPARRPHSSVFSVSASAILGQGALTTALGVMVSYWYLALGRDPTRH